MVQQYVRSFSKLTAHLSLALILGGLTTALSGCAEPKPFMHNAVAPLPMGSLERAWFVDLKLKDDPIVRLDVRDKLIYVYTTSKRVIGFDRKTGTLQMTMKVSSPNRYLLPLVELKKHIVFPTATTLEIFDAQGFYDKSIRLNAPLRSNVAGEGDNVYFGSVGANGGLVESYNVERPYAPANWEYLTTDGGDVTAGVAFYGGILYSGSEKGAVDAVTPGRLQVWDTEKHVFLARGPITADLKADEAGLYIASNDSNLYCVSRTTGKLKWQYFSGSPLTEAPVTTADTVYQYVPGKGLAAIDKVTGAFNRSPRWVHPTATQFLAQDDRYVYLADPRADVDEPGKTVYAIIAVNRDTMKTEFESDHKNFAVLGSNRAKDGLIYGAFADGELFAIKPVIKAGNIGELVMTELNAECKMQNAE